MKRVFLLFVICLVATFVFAQSMEDKPYVIMAPVGSVQVHAGATKDVNLAFRVGSEYHINSHTPKSPLLIPTVKPTGPSVVFLAMNRSGSWEILGTPRPLLMFRLVVPLARTSVNCKLPAEFGSAET